METILPRCTLAGSSLLMDPVVIIWGQPLNFSGVVSFRAQADFILREITHCGSPEPNGEHWARPSERIIENNQKVSSFYG